MKLIAKYAFAALVSLSFATANVSADDAATKECSKESCSKTECAGGACPASAAVAKAMDKLPKMTFLVGTEETCCSASAEALAEKHSKPVQFVVADKTFDSKQKAFAMLVSATEDMVKEFTTAKTCSVSGMTTIAGTQCACSVKAGELADKVKEATQLVSMSYEVNGESCNCPMTAKAMAEKAGVDTTYVVGKEKTSCSQTARLNLARAKYEAAVKAIAAASEEATAAKADSET